MERGNRKKQTGTIVSNKAKNTVVVRVDYTQRHPRYEKVIKRSKKYYAHDPSDKLEIGQTVTIVETRPISKLKRWRVVE